MEVIDPVMALEDMSAVDFIVETLESSSDDEITLVATGPLTNRALAVAGRPELLPKIRRIVLMGGACREGGNVTPSAEFNIHVDPDAAQAVFTCGRPLVVINIDVTNHVRAMPAHADRLADAGSRPARQLSRLLRTVGGAGGEEFGRSGVALHDPCTIAWLLKPELFETQHVNVAIETESDLTLGATVVDFRGVTDRRPNALWASKAAAPEIIELLIDRIARL
jgi:purine nucleosidase